MAGLFLWIKKHAFAYSGFSPTWVKTLG